MRRLTLLLVLLASAGVAEAQWGPPRGLRQRVDVRVRLQGERDVLRADEPARVLVETSDDAHVAVIRIDTDGRLEFLFPDTPWGDDRVEAGRPLSLSARSPSRGLPQRPGIGYVYAIASTSPLDYRAFDRGRRAWDWSDAGGLVGGDPFLALEEITRALLPRRGYAGHGADYQSYYVGARFPYPAYACGAPRRGRGRGWGVRDDWDDCSDLEGFLDEHPDYFDTRRYRGERREWPNPTDRDLDAEREPADERTPRPRERRPVRRRPGGTGGGPS